jgi:uncharacterized protein
VHGYYVLPFLLGDRLVAASTSRPTARAGRLLVRGAFLPSPRSPRVVAGPLAATLEDMARWLRLSDVVIEAHGDLAPALMSLGSRAAG